MKKFICLTLTAIILFTYGGASLVWAALDISVDIYRHPYNDIYGSNTSANTSLYTSPTSSLGSNSDTSPTSSPNSNSGSSSSSSGSGSTSNMNTGIYGSGTVDIVSWVSSPSSDEIYGSTVSMTVKDSSGYIYSNYDYVSGFISTTDNSCSRVDVRTISLPGNDVYRLDTVVTGQNGESSSVTKEFDIRAVRSIPENMTVNFEYANENCIYGNWNPLENVDNYVIYISRESGFSEYFSYKFNVTGYNNNNCMFFVPDGFNSESGGIWQLYLVAYRGDVRVGRSQEFTYCADKNLIAEFKDKNLEAAVRQAINKPSGVIMKSELLNITGLDATSRNISNLEGIQQLANLEGLYLNDNQISDINPLGELKKLRDLSLYNNKVSSIEALQNSTGLYYLNLSNNYINDISVLKNMTNIRILYLKCNDITNYTYVAHYFNKLILKDFYLNPLLVNGFTSDSYYALDNSNNLMFPLRLCAESMGLSASYDNTSKEIILKDNFNVLKLYIDKADYIFNGKPGKLECPLTIVDGRVMASIKPIAKFFNRSVSVAFIGNTLKVDIRQNKTGDLNNDGVINMRDVMIIADVFNSIAGAPDYNEACDLNNDGAINMVDIVVIANKFNTRVSESN